MRDLSIVVGRIKEKIPAEEIDFLIALDKALYNCSYIAPELSYIGWQGIGAVLNKYIKDWMEPWEAEIIAIWTDKEQET